METIEEKPVARFFSGAISLGNLVDTIGMDAIPHLAGQAYRRWARVSPDQASHKNEVIALLGDILMRDAVKYGTRYMPAVSDLWTEKTPDQVRSALPPAAARPADEIVNIALAVLKHNR